MEHVSFWTAVILYALVTIAFWIAWIFQKQRMLTVTLGMFWLAWAINGIAVIARWSNVGHGPYINIDEVLMSNACCLGIVYLVAQWIVPAIRAAGMLVAPTVLLMLGISNVVGSSPTTPPATFDSFWLVIHVCFAKLAYGSFALAAALSVIFLWKTRRAQQENGNTPAPNAGTNHGIYRLTFLGFLALTVMTGAGALWARKAWGRYWGWDPVEIWSLLTWLVYGLFLHLRRTRGWRGRKIAWYSLAAFLLVLLLCFGLTSFVKSVHADYFVR